MKNIYLIPTDKPTMLAYYQEGTSYKESKLQVVKHTSSDYKYQYIYITSDEKINGNDWGLSLGVEGGNLLFKAKNIEYHSTCKKIVLTNDPKLIGDGVQEIGEKFFEWLVLNPSCEEVEVETYLVRSRFIWRTDYRIIITKDEPNHTDWKFEISSGYKGYRNKITSAWIYEDEYLKKFNKPKQNSLKELYLKNNPERATIIEERVNNFIEQLEPKQETTLEEVAERILKSHSDFKTEGFSEYQNGRFNGIIEGLKWQQQNSYSELVDLLERLTPIYREDSDLHQKYDKQRLDIIEQYKNK